MVYDFAAAPKSDHAEMWVADVNGQPVGSIMLQETEETGVGSYVSSCRKKHTAAAASAKP
ncbi:MAG: hypothetical protein MR278_01985 [Bacteroidales bacterium]|nr:hypothetical protein [Anaerotignum sp.]MCI5678744.1 hypothetical protein [Bacteroidales bacterium]MDY3927083.1 hypothetical protein [Anaerotignum sp.]